MDLDGDVDWDDVDDFVLGLSDALAYESIHGLPPAVHGDMDQDGDFATTTSTGSSPSCSPARGTARRSSR